MSSSTSEAEFQFWALTIPKNSEKKLEMENDKSVYHISNATLGNEVSQGRTTIYFNAKGKKAPICNLVDKTLENASLDLIVSRSMNASFTTQGPNAVTVSGYVQPLVDESDTDMPTVFDLPITNGADGAVEETKQKEKVAPIQEQKESKKRKLDETEAPDVAKASEKKRNKKKRKRKKKNQKADEEASTTQTDKTEEAVVESKKAVNEKEDKEEPAKESTPKKSKSSKKSKKMVDAGKGVTYRVLKKGKEGGKPAKKGDSITLLYVGCLQDGTQFDKNLKEGLTFKIGGDEVIPGIELGVMGMRSKEKRRITIPPEQGYGEDGASEGKIPPNAELTFTVQRK